MAKREIKEEDKDEKNVMMVLAEKRKAREIRRRDKEKE